MARNDSFQYPGVQQPDIVSVCRDHVAADTAIDLGQDCSTIEFSNYTGSADLHINLNNAAATTAHFKLAAGEKFTYKGPPLRYFHVISSAATAKWSYLAY